MKRACIALVTGYALGLLLLGFGASAQVTRPAGVSTTTHNQILVNLAPADTTAANPLDPRTNLIAAIPDARDPELPGHLDLIEVAIYGTNGNAVVVEFTTREPAREPDEGTRLSYRLAFDGDHPYWDPDYSRSRAGRRLRDAYGLAHGCRRLRPRRPSSGTRGQSHRPPRNHSRGPSRGTRKRHRRSRLFRPPRLWSSRLFPDGTD